MSALGVRHWRAGLRMHPPIVEPETASVKRRVRRHETIEQPKPEPAEPIVKHELNGGPSKRAPSLPPPPRIAPPLDFDDEPKPVQPNGWRRRTWDKRTWRPMSAGPTSASSALIPATPRQRHDSPYAAARGGPRKGVKAFRKAGTDEIVYADGKMAKIFDYRRDILEYRDTPSRRLACRTDDDLTATIESLLVEAQMHPPKLIASTRGAAGSTPSAITRSPPTGGAASAGSTTPPAIKRLTGKQPAATSSSTESSSSSNGSPPPPPSKAASPDGGGKPAASGRASPSASRSAITSARPTSSPPPPPPQLPPPLQPRATRQRHKASLPMLPPPPPSSAQRPAAKSAEEQRAAAELAEHDFAILTQSADATPEAVTVALADLSRLCEVGDDEGDDEGGNDASAPPCLVRMNGDVVDFMALISTVVRALEQHSTAEVLQAAGCSLISKLANCDAAIEQAIDAGAFAVIGAALRSHSTSRLVQQYASIAVLKLTLPGYTRAAESRDALRVQRAISDGIVESLAAIVHRYDHSSSAAAAADPLAPLPLRLRLCAAAKAWIEYIEYNYLAPTLARTPGAFAARARSSPTSVIQQPEAEEEDDDDEGEAAAAAARLPLPHDDQYEELPIYHDYLTEEELEELTEDERRAYFESVSAQGPTHQHSLIDFTLPAVLPRRDGGRGDGDGDAAKALASEHEGALQQFVRDMFRGLC